MSSEINVVFSQPQEIVVDFGVAPGPNEIGGYPIVINQSIVDGDLVQFKTGGYWTNASQTNITDGGNF